MPIYVIDKIKQKNDGDFYLLDASDINWDIDIPADSLPDNVYTKTEVNTQIQSAISGAGHLKRVVLASGATLPTVGEDNTIYMLPSSSPSSQNTYEEYMYINSSWEKIGSSDVDLSNYATKSEVSSSGSTVLNDAKSYADTKDAAVLASAKEYSDSQSDATLASAKSYVDQEKAKYLPLAGGTMTGKITGIVTPTANSDAANKAYVDSVAASLSPDGMLVLDDFTTGTVNGAIAVQGQNITVYGLKSAAFTEASDYLAANSLDWQPIP